jgi:hypothetical protein
VTAAEATGDHAPAPRYVVTGGGEPSRDELAAVVVALTPVAVVARDAGPARPPAWTRAALVEGVGHRTLVSAPDLDAAAPPR